MREARGLRGVGMVMWAVLAAAGCDDDVATAAGVVDAAGRDAAADAAFIVDAAPGPDAAPPEVDAAKPEADAAPPALDAAPPEVDAAPPEIDAAPPEVDAAPPEVDAAPPEVDAAPPEVDAGPIRASECLAAQYVNGGVDGPDYDQFHGIIGAHCEGTNHQQIDDIERVVFVGDSITVGTPPNDPATYYRVRMAGRLAEHFGLQAPDPLWWQVNLIDGVGLVRDSGDFANCAKYGARTDDLLQDRQLMSDCVPEETRDRRTLFVMTMGGNDIASLTQHAIEGRSVEDLWVQTTEFVDLMRDAMRWVRAPDRFPNGVFVVFANLYEFTDGTADLTSCPAAGLAGFGAPVPDPDALRDMVIWANEQYMAIAVEYGVDMTFMLEGFCGHGFRAADEDGPCYRGPNSEVWFDLTCIHPNALGHGALADLFMDVILE